MTDSVSVQTLHDGDDYFIIHLTNTSDGAGEDNVVKTNISTMRVPTGHSSVQGLALKAFVYSTINMGVAVAWQANTNQQLAVFPPNTRGSHEYVIAEVYNNAGIGKTGNVVLTTIGPNGNSSPVIGSKYDLVLTFRKVYA